MDQIGPFRCKNDQILNIKLTIVAPDFIVVAVVGKIVGPWTHNVQPKTGVSENDWEADAAASDPWIAWIAIAKRYSVFWVSKQSTL